MANGGKRVVFNTRERIISSDFNRLQDMVGQGRAALMARRHNDAYQFHLPGYAPRVTTGGQSPMVADVYGGLFVKVDDPTSLFIDSGVVGVVDPDASPGLDDEAYKLIDDPGFQTSGVLTFLANGSGSRRIDIITADVVDLVLETDLRDIYDTSTGLFTPQNVNKVVAKRLSYGITRGTAGGGMPTIPNRIVLAVASVPNGVVNWAGVTFWDVRPLVSERMPQNNSKRRFYDFDFWSEQSGEHHGYITTEYNGYIAGGKLMSSVPSSDTVFNALSASMNSTSTSGMTDESTSPNDCGCNPIVALFPNGLPRWARYSSGNAPGLSIRAPYGPRGILVAGRRRINDHIKCDRYGNVTGLALPTSTGLTGTANGVLLYMAAISKFAQGGDFVQWIPAQGSGRRITFSSRFSSLSLYTLPSIVLPVITPEQHIFMTINIDNIITSTSLSYSGVAPNMSKLFVMCKPAAVMLKTGTAAPNAASYSQIGFGICEETADAYFDQYWGQDLPGVDGTSIPTTPISPILEIPIRHSPDDSNPATVLTIAITDGPTVTGSRANSFGSKWVFADSEGYLIMCGYEV
jgi:hypothetical protein